MDKLEEIRKVFEGYKADPAFEHLRKDRINFVPGSGPLTTDLMIIGDAPGKTENSKRIPFVGRSGSILTDLLENINVDPYHVYMTNAVKYWPRNEEENKSVTPSTEDLQASKPYLLKEIDIVEPLVVGLCGFSTITTFYPEFQTVYDHNGELYDDLFVPLYFPSMSSHNRSKSHQVGIGFARMREHLKEKLARIDSANPA